MSYSDLTIVNSLARSMQHTARRNRVLAQNIANVDTPNYKAQDLVKQQFPATLRKAYSADLTRTHRAHFQSSAFKTLAPIIEVKNTDEKTISGNTVNLEQNLVKINENSAQHERATSLYRKYFSFINIASGRAGARR